MNPTGRTLKLLRQQGFLAGVVERWVPGANVRQDLFGCGDVLAVHPRDKTFLLVQATTAGNFAARIAKAKRQPELAGWLRAGGRFEVHGWQKIGGEWKARVAVVRLDDVAGVTADLPRRRKPDRQPVLF